MIVVTGCAGFIGWKTTLSLLERGDSVLGIDDLNDYYDPKIKEWRLSTLSDKKNFEFHKLDISNYEILKELLNGKKIESIINLAARAGVRASVENPWLYLDANVKGTLNLLEICKDRGIKKFVLASTSSIYGLEDMPFSEDIRTDKPLAQYPATKKGAEVLCYSYYYLYGIDISIPRYFTVYGPAGRPDMSIFQFIKRIDEGMPIKVFGDGKQKRDFTYIDDIVEGTIRGLRPLGYEIFNLGNNNSIELSYVIGL
ncbi:MAG: NAD-dependent epimerase/dehydratase family protein, partial [Nitrospirota bacterium]